MHQLHEAIWDLQPTSQCSTAKWPGERSCNLWRRVRHLLVPQVHQQQPAGKSVHLLSTPPLPTPLARLAATVLTNRPPCTHTA